MNDGHLGPSSELDSPPVTVPEISVDNLVVGSGMAGFAAALALKKRGRRVEVIASTNGATSVSSGGWDFGPIPSRYPGQGRDEGPLGLDELRVSREWQQAYRGLLFEEKGGAAASELRQSALDIADALARDLKLAFEFKRSFLLPTSAGTWKRTFGAQELQARADVRNLKGKKVGFVTSDHWRFRADLVAKRWMEASSVRGERIDISPCWIHFDIPSGDWPIPHVAARLLNDGRFRSQFLDAIEDRLHGTHYDLLLFPPLFLDPGFAEVIAKEFHVGVAECLSTVEPTAGHRLSRALALTLEKLSVPIHRASRCEATVSDGLVRHLRYFGGQPMGWRQIKASGYVLATGKLFGGGVKMGYERVEEPVFRLPLFSGRDGTPVEYRSQLPWSETRFHDEQAWAQLGVWVDENWRPLDRGLRPVAKNLVACGSVLGGLDFARHGLGLGFMAYSGRQCGRVI